MLEHILGVHEKRAASLQELKEELSAHTIFGVDASFSLVNIVEYTEYFTVMY